jgi:hypothetical protein
MKDSQTAPYLAQVLIFINQNSKTPNILKKLTDFDIGSMKEKFEELKEMKDVTNQFEDLKKSLPKMGGDSEKVDKPLEQYSKKDIQKLTDILKSVEKD